MPFHAYTKPADYVLPKATTRSNFVFDGDRISGNVRILMDYRDGETASSFTAANGTVLNGFRTDRGVKADLTPDCWNRFIGGWEIQSNKARTTAAGFVTMPTEATLPADIDISVDVSATAAAGLYLRRINLSGADHFRIVLEFPAARLKAYEIFNFTGATKLTGSTVLTSGTTYTLRVTTVGSTFNVYLNGSLEGTFTSTVNQTTGVDHGLLAIDDTAARFDNYVIARRGLPAATTYTVRNYDGDIVTTGSITNEYVDIVDSLLKQRSNRGPYGWYRVYLTGPNHGDGQWGTAYGDCTFIRIPTSSLPVNGSPTQPSGASLYDSRDDEIARGVMGLGTSRISIQNAGLPPATTIAAILPAVSGAKTWQTDTASAARPRKLMVAFPNGTAGNEANVTAIVNGLKAYVSVWECRNEPNGYQAAATWTPGEFAAFHTAVKAGDATATVIGPGTVSFNDSEIPYFQAFLDAGGGASSEAFSFHPYNCYNGDLALTRRTLGAVLTKMAAAGKSSYDMWMTEQGFAWTFAGVVWPRYAARWNALMYFGQSCITADKMRPETTAYWYDNPVGFDPFPEQWLSDSGPGPTMAPVRTMSAEIFGKTFTSEFDFGTYGKNLYVGGTWSGADGTKAVGVMAASAGAPDLLLNVVGGPNLTCVDPWGNTFTVTAVNGYAVFPIAELPQWIRCPVGTTVTPTALGLTTNLALTATATSDGAPGAGSTSGGTTYVALSNDVVSVVNNDIQENQYGFGTEVYKLVAPTLPVTVTLTWPSVITLNRVLVHSFPPWNVAGAPLALHIDTWDGSAWTTRYTKTTPTVKSFAFTSGVARCTFETFFDEQWIFDAQFLTVATSKIRIVFTDTSYASGEVARAYDDLWGAWLNGTPQTLAIREIQAFNVSGNVVISSQGRNPAMGGVLR